MSSADRAKTLLDALAQGLSGDRLAHAYLIVGSPRGDGLSLVLSLLQRLYCTGEPKPCGRCKECERVPRRTHPDIKWLEPESRSRKIVIGEDADDEPSVRNLNRFIALSPMAGSRKVGVVLHADRMTDGAANAFLKTLEEPPPSSLLLLVSDRPEALLPTILSRCQRILLSTRLDSGDAPWRETLMTLLRRGPPTGPIEAFSQAAAVKALLDAVKERVETEVWEEMRGRPAEEEAAGDDEVQATRDVVDARIAARVLEQRERILRTLLLWRRDVLMAAVGLPREAFTFPEEADVLKRQAAGLTVVEALARVREVEEIVRRLDRNLPVEVVLSAVWG